mmetsp:Transcript_82779/g.261468  ORF Transcript_82779/g.261468 Transcript_82779/m.261468 type:complete len:221 (+) Transcript_82779:817-1479(+)
MACAWAARKSTQSMGENTTVVVALLRYSRAWQKRRRWPSRPSSLAMETHTSPRYTAKYMTVRSTVQSTAGLTRGVPGPARSAGACMMQTPRQMAVKQTYTSAMAAFLLSRACLARMATPLEASAPSWARPARPMPTCARPAHSTATVQTSIATWTHGWGRLWRPGWLPASCMACSRAARKSTQSIGTKKTDSTTGAQLRSSRFLSIRRRRFMVCRTKSTE